MKKPITAIENKQRPPIAALTAARKEARKSQSELASEMYLLIHGSLEDYNARAYQNRISYLERGKLRPTDQELSAIASVLHKDYEEIRRWFRIEGGPGAHLVDQVLTELAHHDGLMIVCATSVPAGERNPRLQGNVVTAIKEGLSFALAVPYPHQATAVAPENSEHRPLRLYQEQVRDAVRRYAQGLREDVEREAEGRCSSVQMFTPAEPGDSTLIPPFHQRYVLTCERKENSIASKLYVWVTTRSLNELQLVEDRKQQDMLSKTDLWENFLEPIMAAWKEGSYKCFGKLPDGYWKSELPEV